MERERGERKKDGERGLQIQTNIMFTLKSNLTTNCKNTHNYIK